MPNTILKRARATIAVAEACAVALRTTAPMNNIRSIEMTKSGILTLIIYLFAANPILASDGGIYIGPDPRVPGWERADPAKWSPNKAATAAELIGALLVAPLETLDGDPDVKVHIWKVEETFRAAVKAINLLDDAFHSEETVIAVKEDKSGWIVTEVWKRWICRRGENAGEWTNKSCP